VLSPAAYRQSLCLTLFYKFFLEMCAKQTTPLPARLASAIIKYQRPVSSGVCVCVCVCVCTCMYMWVYMMYVHVISLMCHLAYRYRRH